MGNPDMFSHGDGEAQDKPSAKAAEHKMLVVISWVKASQMAKGLEMKEGAVKIWGSLMHSTAETFHFWDSVVLPFTFPLF